MYTEEYERRTFPIRDFLLKIILVILFIFLLIWLLPKLFVSSPSKVTEDYSPLLAQIFSQNLKKMQDAATSYYTDERLPQNVGDAKQMTLRQMIAENLLVPFVDQYGKACSVDKSYVKITKMDDEYLMKVNLKCSKEEDYILVHMGCYTYCKKDICEKKETTVIKDASVPAPAIPQSSPQKGGESLPDVPVEPEKGPVPTPQKGKEYEYKKTTGAKMSNWSDWSAWTKNVNDYPALDCSDSDPTCVKKRQLFSRKEQIGTYQKAYVVGREEQRQYGSYQEKACANFNYVRINETTYQTTNVYGTVSSITSSSGSSVGSWVYSGTYTDFIPPQDTAGVHYVYQGLNFSCNGCSGSPKYTYKKYVYQGGLTNVTAGSSTTETLLSSSTVKNTNTSIRVTCANVTVKTIPVYKTVTVYDKDYHEEPYYGTVHYYSEKTRTVKEKGKTVTKWSDTPNDQTLIKQGYYYTGNSRDK